MIFKNSSTWVFYHLEKDKTKTHLIAFPTLHQRIQICRLPRPQCSIAVLVEGFWIVLTGENCIQDCAGCEEFAGRGEFGSCANLVDCDDCVDCGRKDLQQSDHCPL